jgi:predicted transcriptional regulator
VRRAMVTDFKTLEADEPLSRAVGLLMSGAQQDFPVMESGRLAGILSRTALIEALQRLGESAPVRQAMLCDVVVLEPEAMLEEAAQRLQSQECHTAPVLQNDTLVGLLTMENIGEFIMIQSALRRAARAARSGPGWAAQ